MKILTAISLYCWRGDNLLLGESYAGADAGEILVQLHSHPDQRGQPAPYDAEEPWESRGGSPIALATDQGRFRLMVRYNPHHDPKTGTDPQQTKGRSKLIDPAVATPMAYVGRWLAVVLHFQLSFTPGSGFTRLYLGDATTRDLQRAAEILGPNSYNDFRGPYLKIGIYKPMWKDGKPAENGVLESRQWHADLKIAGAGARLEDVVTLAPDPGLAQIMACLTPLLELAADHYGLQAYLALPNRRGYTQVTRTPPEAPDA